MTRVVVLHSPYCGPSSVLPLAECLGAEVHACGTIPAADVVIAHSGASSFVVEMEFERCVLIDSALPPSTGTASLATGTFRAFLDTIAINGVLPPWGEWWGVGAMQMLIDDPVLRAQIASECPRVLLSVVDEQRPVRTGWDTHGCGYVQLSALYAQDADEAEQRGWPTVRLHGRHLDTARDPRQVADATAQVLEMLR